MTRPALDGLFGVKLPVTDLTRSLRWYQEVFGLEVYLEFPDDDGVVRGVACRAAGLGDTAIGLRENPAVARGIAGFDPVIWAVPDQAALEEWVTHLDTLGIAHSPVIDASIGWLLVFHDPDGLEIHLYTRTKHGIDQDGRSGYGRPTETGAATA